MKQNLILSYIYDFLSVAFENNELKPNLRNIILFGSVARNNYDENSDIDLFFDLISNKESVESFLRHSLKSFEVSSLSKWKLKGVALPIKLIVGKLRDPQWESLRHDILSNGLTLYSKFEDSPDNPSHYFIIYYEMGKTKSKNKMKFIRQMFGYTNKKGKKNYLHKGYLEIVGGKKLCSGSILVPTQFIEDAKKIFDKFKINPKIIEAWLNK